MRLRRVARSLDQRGAAAIEFAVVLPLLMLFAFGLIDLGRAVWIQSTLNYAAQAAARCTAINAATCPALASYAYGLSGVTTAIATCTITTSTGTSSGVQASASVPFRYFFPLFAHYSPVSGSLTATACYPK